MLRKAYVPGAAALLAALLLAGCAGGGSSDGGRADDSNPDGAGTATPAAQPGKYRTLPEACSAVDHGSLDSLLPGLKQITDPDQRDKAYAGRATLTYDTDRRVGCRWKVDATDATDRLHVDFERVVSYDNTVSDDTEAESVFAGKRTAADLPVPGPHSSGAGTGSGGAPASSGAPSGDASPSAPSSSGTVQDDLQPRTLDGLGDEAFLDDTLTGSGSAARRRTVTVAFRTSNVIVTIEYTEQSAAPGVVPDSKEMQDKARKLAAHLAGSLGG